MTRRSRERARATKTRKNLLKGNSAVVDKREGHVPANTYVPCMSSRAEHTYTASRTTAHYIAFCEQTRAPHTHTTMIQQLGSRAEWHNDVQMCVVDNKRAWLKLLERNIRWGRKLARQWPCLCHVCVCDILGESKFMNHGTLATDRLILYTWTGSLFS